MFTFIASGLMLAITWWSGRSNGKDRKEYDGLTENELVSRLVLLSRQDLKLIAMLLGGIMILLGVIADRT